MTISSSGWGGSSWGGSAWGGAVDGDIGVSAVLAVKENQVLIAFTAEVFITRLLEPADASRPEKYSVTPIAGTRGLDDTACRPVTVVYAATPVADDGLDFVAVGDRPRNILLTLDRPMTPSPARYRLAIFGVFARDLSSEYSGEVDYTGLFKLIDPPRVDLARRTRDIANPQSRETALSTNIPQPSAAGVLGTFNVGDDGDYAFDEGIASLKKRILRRLVTATNGFAHLPGYGVGVPQQGKRLGVSANLTAIAANAQVQIGREPEVARVRVLPIVSRLEQGIVRFQVYVQTRDGKAQKFSVPFLVPIAA